MANELPSKIQAGVTFALTLTLTTYPPDDWTLTLIMRGPQAIDLTSTADGGSHLITADAETTAEWAPGRYWCSLRATDGTEVVELSTGDVEVLRDLAQVTGAFDGRGHVRKVLDAIEAVIEGRASLDQQSYKIGDRELVRMSVAELLKFRDRYRAELAREEAAARSGQSLLGRRVAVRFT